MLESTTVTCGALLEAIFVLNGWLDIGDFERAQVVHAARSDDAKINVAARALTHKSHVKGVNSQNISDEQDH